MYMWIASNRNITTSYGPRGLTLDYDEKRKVLFYTILINGSESDTRIIEANWKGNMFDMDDYYLGEHINDSPVPMPG